MDVELTFEILSYWHAGSGRGRDAVLDAEVARDPDGLPYLPGKTIKGLIRKAMKIALHARGQGLAPVVRWLGSEVAGFETTDGDQQMAALEGGRFGTEPGKLWFGSASLPPTWGNWVRANPAEVTKATIDSLFGQVASTAVDARGVAKDHTLRVSEVAVPMTLVATVSGPSDDATWVDLVRQALPHVRTLGVRGRRGYGRVRVTLGASATATGRTRR